VNSLVFSLEIGSKEENKNPIGFFFNCWLVKKWLFILSASRLWGIMEEDLILK